MNFDTLLFFFFFFFKQKTAYEMRISDWSSDVCSSDLGFRRPGRSLPHRPPTVPPGTSSHEPPDIVVETPELLLNGQEGLEIGRASCRERCVSTCRSRWSQYH